MSILQLSFLSLLPDIDSFPFLHPNAEVAALQTQVDVGERIHVVQLGFGFNLLRNHDQLEDEWITRN